MTIHSVADRLFMIAGVFEKYRETGGHFTANEAQFLEAQLRACAEQARADQLHRDYLIEVESDPAHPLRFQPDDAPPAARRCGVFGVIDGGRA